MAENIIVIVISIPLVVLLILSYLKPEEMLIWGKRSFYKEEPEFTEEYINFTKYASLVALMFIFSIVIKSLSNILGLISIFLTLAFIFYLIVLKK